MRYLMNLSGAFLLAFAVSGAGTASAGIKCKCRFNGGYIEEGQTACLKTPTGMSLARCEKVLNNTSWKILNQPCPFALKAPDLKLQTPFPVKLVTNS